MDASIFFEDEGKLPVSYDEFVRVLLTPTVDDRYPFLRTAGGSGGTARYGAERVVTRIACLRSIFSGRCLALEEACWIEGGDRDDAEAGVDGPRM